MEKDQITDQYNTWIEYHKQLKCSSPRDCVFAMLFFSRISADIQHTQHIQHKKLHLRYALRFSQTRTQILFEMFYPLHHERHYLKREQVVEPNNYDDNEECMAAIQRKMMDIVWPTILKMTSACTHTRSHSHTELLPQRICLLEVKDPSDAGFCWNQLQVQARSRQYQCYSSVFNTLSSVVFHNR